MYLYACSMYKLVYIPYTKNIVCGFGAVFSGGADEEDVRGCFYSVLFFKFSPHKDSLFLSLYPKQRVFLNDK